MNAKAKQDNAKPDGRALRSERSRQTIVEAMMSLVEAGNLVPTAQQVADKAGVGIRTVFRHFSDMESLFNTSDARMRETYENLFLGGDREGILAERIDHAVERHANAYETLRLMILSTQAQMWKSPTLRKNYARNQRGLRKDLNDWLPELKELPSIEREAVDVAASFEAWHRLREHQGLSKKAAVKVVTSLISQLLDAT